MPFDRKAYIREYQRNRRAGRPQPPGKLKRYEAALRWAIEELKDTKTEKGRSLVARFTEALGEG